MTMYCPECKQLYDGEKCPECKRAGREPAPEDWCRVYDGGQIWADMAADVLKQNDIPSLVQSSRGAAMAVLTGVFSDTWEVYVPFPNCADAEAILQELFSADAIVEEDMPEEEEEDGEPDI